MKFYDPTRSARALIARADKVIVLGEQPKDGEELWVTVIVAGQHPLGARADSQASGEAGTGKRSLAQPEETT